MFVDMFVNSFFIWGFSLTVGLFLGLIVAYYIYKKCAGSGFFKVMLFAPCVISGTVMIAIFKQIADVGFPALAEVITGKYVVGLLTNPDSAFLTILIYNIWFGLGGNMLLYLGSMEQINESVIESAKLEGVGFMREFFCITLPSIYPTFVTFVTVGVAGFFSNNMSLYLFYGLEADSSLMNVGYYLFVSVLNAGYDRIYGDGLLRKREQKDSRNSFGIAEKARFGYFFGTGDGSFRGGHRANCRRFRKRRFRRVKGNGCR